MAGRSTVRMSVASRKTATARPRPSSRMMTRRSVMNTAKTTTMIAAALVTVPAVTVMPRATASRVFAPRSTNSLTRERMKTS